MVSNDFEQILPSILQIAENSRIYYERVTNIFMDLQKEMQEDINKEKEPQENILSPDSPEIKKPILKFDSQSSSNKNKSFKFKEELIRRKLR